MEEGQGRPGRAWGDMSVAAWALADLRIGGDPGSLAGLAPWPRHTVRIRARSPGGWDIVGEGAAVAGTPSGTRGGPPSVTQTGQCGHGLDVTKHIYGAVNHNESGLERGDLGPLRPSQSTS